MLIFFAFIILLLLSVRNIPFGQKSYQDWVLDGIGLFFQGIVIPILQMTIVYQIYRHLFTGAETIVINPVAGFCLSFVFVDYLYYWNHRLFHTNALWFLHKVHHTVTETDVLATSRNTLWTSLLIIYLWIHPLFIYLLQDSTWYVLGASLTSALDLWRHSIFTPKYNSLLYRYLSPWLIIPQDHAWHHASSSIVANYGANLKIWDQIHGTYYESDTVPKSLGISTNLNIMQKLFYPWG